VTEIEDAPASARAIVKIPQTAFLNLNKRGVNKTERAESGGRPE
jgi:hypothetical protein